MGIRRALLVGINYPGTAHPLQGCVNDVNLMADVLTEHYGFTDATQRRMLTDESATTANILERLEWLVADTKPGDVLYFHFSGHGSQMVNQTYEADVEPDGLDEIICPMDLNWRDKVIRDDDLKRIFDKVPNGVAFTVVLDCCNSGSGLDQLNQYQPLGAARQVIAANSPNRDRWLPMPDDIANRARGLDIKPRARSVQSRDVNNTGMMISGCQSHQTSADAWIHDRFMGAATYYLSESLKNNNYDVPHQTVVEEMNNSMVKYGYTQRPELNGSADLFATKFLQPVVVGTGLEEPTTAVTETLVDEILVANDIVEEVVIAVDPVVNDDVIVEPEPQPEPPKRSKWWIAAGGLLVVLAIVAYSMK